MILRCLTPHAFRNLKHLAFSFDFLNCEWNWQAHNYLGTPHLLKFINLEKITVLIGLPHEPIAMSSTTELPHHLFRVADESIGLITDGAYVGSSSKKDRSFWVLLVLLHVINMLGDLNLSEGNDTWTIPTVGVMFTAMNYYNDPEYCTDQAWFSAAQLLDIAAWTNDGEDGETTDDGQQSEESEDDGINDKKA
ncbi:hypothetical protein B0O99DRAFT_639344 [Bisporella sp. PMI_857]|nr:hypothetical protein B0O99DRAFT_639344 [Bisporella sp. PMI_857]